MHTFKKEITVDVPKKERAGYQTRLEEVDREIIRVQAEKTEANTEFNKTLKDLRKDQGAILTALDTGKATVEVECYEEIDEQRLEVMTKRVDTDEVLVEYTRPMTAEERQMRIGDGDEAA